MAVSRTTGAMTDTTEVVVFLGAAYLTGVYVADNNTSTEMFVQLWDATGVTPGTTAPDISLYIPARALTQKGSYRFSFPRIRMATGIEVFVSTTAGGATAALNLGVVEVYYEPLA